MLTTRRATLADTKNMVDELNKFIGACNIYYPKAEIEALATSIHASFHHTSPSNISLCLQGDKIVGISSVIASRYLWANKMQAEIRLIYVSPDHRNSRAFHYLLRDIETWCAEKKCDQISWQIASGVNDEEIASILRKRGWNDCGICMVKTV